MIKQSVGLFWMFESNHSTGRDLWLVLLKLQQGRIKGIWNEAKWIIDLLIKRVKKNKVKIRLNLLFYRDYFITSKLQFTSLHFRQAVITKWPFTKPRLQVAAVQSQFSNQLVTAGVSVFASLHFCQNSCTWSGTLIWHKMLVFACQAYCQRQLTRISLTNTS